MPAGIIGFAFKAMSKGNLARDIMSGLKESNQLNHEPIKYFSEDILDDARRLGSQLPRIMVLEDLFI